MILEILAMVNLWCQPVEFELEEFFYCRQTLLSCVQQDLKKNVVLSNEAYKCFEKMDKELKKNSEMTAMKNSHAKAT